MTIALVISNAVVAAVSVVTLLVLLFRVMPSIEKRLTGLEAKLAPLAGLEGRVANVETKVEPYWDAFQQIVVSHLQGISPGGNPVTAERWQYLLSRFQNNILSFGEARELQAAFLEQQKRLEGKTIR